MRRKAHVYEKVRRSFSRQRRDLLELEWAEVARWDCSTGEKTGANAQSRIPTNTSESMEAIGPLIFAEVEAVCIGILILRAFGAHAF